MAESGAVVVGFDTATEALAVGVLARDGRAFTRHAAGGAAASAALLPQLLALLQQAGVALADVGHVAFGRGPGAFTGLRTACAAAQGLAFGLGREVLAIDSLMIVAEDAHAQAGAPAAFDVAVVMDARMGEAYAARYARTPGGRWQVLLAPSLLAPAALALAFDATPPQAWAGNGLRAFAAQWRAPAGTVEYATESDRAAALLRLAARAAAAGEGVDAAQALPVYLRDKVALTTRERAAAAAP